MSQEMPEVTVKKDNEYYKRNYKRLSKTVVEIVHQNAALCQEISRTEEKFNTIKTERKYLLKKLMQYEKPNLNSLRSIPKKGDPKNASTNMKATGKGKRGQSSRNKGDGQPSQGSGHVKTDVIFVKPIQVDQNGRPIFPIELGDLSIYSIGEIVHDRLGYHEKGYIFPLGYCSTRLFSSVSNNEQRRLYTCKIFDNGQCPRFEISPEDIPETTFLSNSLAEVYLSFRRALGPQSLQSSTMCAAEFFGLSNPVVQNLIQSLPGASKCIGYDWKKIEVVYPGSRDQKSKSAKSRVRQSDINIEALEKWARDT